MLGLVLAEVALVAATPGMTGAAEEGVHRGEGWYSPDARVPEPPLALALVIVAAAGMRARERRLRRG